MYDVIVIGGGQSGLAAGYHLRQKGLRYLILDANKEIGGSHSELGVKTDTFGFV